MANTTFSGPVKAGTIKDTTGSTVGTNVANVGYALMAQAEVISITGVQGINLVATIPANSKIISVVLNVTTANDDSTASTVSVGTFADADAFLSATSVQAAGVTFSDVMDVCLYRRRHYGCPSYSYFCCYRRGRNGGCCRLYCNVHSER
jgi:hypothetical protein